MFNIGIVGSRRPSEESIIKLINYLDWFIANIDDQVGIVTGGSYGADSIGMAYAASRGLELTVYRPKEWHNSEFCERLLAEGYTEIFMTGASFLDRHTFIVEDSDILICPDYGNGTLDAFEKAVIKNIPIVSVGLYRPAKDRFRDVPPGVIHLGQPLFTAPQPMSSFYNFC